MATSVASENELEWLGEIILEAKKKVEPKPPTVTDVLKVYDEFINKKKVSSNTQIAKSVYKKILQIARQMKSGDDWSDKLIKGSALQLKPPMIMRENRENRKSERPSFSFCRDSAKENRPMNINQSFTHDNVINESISEMYEPRRTSSAAKQRGTIRRDENSGYEEVKPRLSEKKNLWDDNINHVYKNRHLRGEDQNKSKLTSPGDDYYTNKYRGQSPPMRDNNYTTSTSKILSEKKENIEVVNSGGKAEESLELSQVYNIFKYKKQRGSEKRTQSVTDFSKVVKDSGYSRSNVKEYESPAEIEYSPTRERDRAIYNRKLLDKYFEAFKVFFWRQKRINSKISILRANFREKRLKFAIDRWRGHMKGDEEGGVKSKYELYYQRTLMSRYFNTWKSCQSKITKFTVRVKNFFLSQRRTLTIKIFQAWKTNYKGKKTRKINKIAAQALSGKKMLKNFFKEWSLYTAEKRIYNKLSLAACLRYKEKLKRQAFTGISTFKKIREAENEQKFMLLNKGDILYKKKCFHLFKERYKEYKDIKTLNRNAKRFWLKHNFKIFMTEFPKYIHRQRELAFLYAKAEAFRNISLAKKSLHSWFLHIDNVRQKLECCQEYSASMLAKKVLSVLQQWKVSRALPDFAFQGKAVWVMYNFLNSFVKPLAPKSFGSGYKSRDVSHRSRSSYRSREIEASPVPVHDLTLNDEFENGFNFQFRIPEVVSLARNPKHRQLYYSANDTLNLYVQQKLFEHWKDRHFRIKDFNRKMYLKTLSKYFGILDNYSTQKVIRKHKASTCVEKKSKQKVGISFAVWKKLTQKKKSLLRKYQEDHQRREKESVNKFWATWRSKTTAMVSEKGLLKQAEVFHDSQAIRKGFIGFMRYLVWSAKSRSITEQIAESQNARLLRSIFRLWISVTSEKQGKNQKKFRSQVISRRNLMDKVFQAWAKHHEYKQRVAEILAVYRIRNKKILLSKIMKSWRRHAKDTSIKHHLVENLDKHYSNKLINKAYFTLFAYRERKVLQKEQDRKLTHEISKLPLQRFFKQWFKASIYSISLPHFVKMFESLQMKQFFKNIHLKTYKEEMLRKAMTENYLYHVQRIFFYAYKRFWRKTQELKIRTHVFKKHSKRMKMEFAYQLWRKKFIFEKNVVFLYAKAVIQIKNEIMGKCFYYLKKRCVLRKKLQLKMMEKTLIDKQKFLNAWALFTKKKDLLNIMALKYQKTATLRTKQKYLYVIGQRYAKRNRDRDIGNLIIRAKKHQFLSLWAHSYNMQSSSIRKISLHPFDFTCKTKTPRKAVFNYKLSQKPYREFYERLNEMYTSYLQNKFFSQWSNFVANARSLKQKVVEFRGKSNFVRNHFNVWRNLFVSRRNLTNKLGNLVDIMNRYCSQVFFKQLVFSVTRGIEEEILDEKALMIYVNNLRNKAFYGWSGVVKNKLRKETNYDVATSIYAGNLLRKSLMALSEYKNYRSERKKNVNQAFMIYAFQLMRKHFVSWKSHYAKKSILLSRVEEFKRKRMDEAAPLFFQQLKLNFYLDSFKKIAIPKVDRFYSRILKIKSFLGFKVNFTGRRLKLEAQEVAESHYTRHLVLKSLRGWLTGLAEKKERKEARKVLVEEIDRIRDRNLLSSALSMWKLYKEESNEYLLNIRTYMVENSLKRILAFWKQYKDNKQKEKSLALNFDAYKTGKMKSQFFQRWRGLWGVKSVLNGLVKNMSKHHMRVCFYEIYQSSTLATFVQNHKLKADNKLKSKYMSRWIQYLRTLKEDRLRYDLISKRQAVIDKKVHFAGWKKLLSIEQYRKSQEKRLIERIFLELNQHSIKMRRYREIATIMEQGVMEKCINSLLQNKEDQIRCKTIMKRLIIQRDRNLKMDAINGLQHWVKKSQEMILEQQRLSFAAEYAASLLVNRAWAAFKEHHNKCLTVKTFVAKIESTRRRIEPRFNMICAFETLRQYHESQNSLISGFAVLQGFMQKKLEVFTRLKQNAIQKDKYRLLAIEVDTVCSVILKKHGFHRLMAYAQLCTIYDQKASDFIITREFHQMKKMFTILREFAKDSKLTKLHLEISNQFLFEIHYINIERNVFTAWKKLLHGFDNRIDSEHPKFKSNVENNEIRTLRKCFLVWKQGAENRTLIDSPVEDIDQLHSQRSLRNCFNVLKGLHFDEKNKSARSKLYTIFSSWKLYAKEQALLNKYLKESGNEEEEFTYAPYSNRTGGDDKLAVSSRNFSLLTGRSSETRHRTNDYSYESPGYFDKL